MLRSILTLRSVSNLNSGSSCNILGGLSSNWQHVFIKISYGCLSNFQFRLLLNLSKKLIHSLFVWESMFAWPGCALYAFKENLLKNCEFWCIFLFDARTKISQIWWYKNRMPSRGLRCRVASSAAVATEMVLELPRGFKVDFFATDGFLFSLLHTSFWEGLT